MKSVGGDGYGLSQQIDQKLDQLIERAMMPVAMPSQNSQNEINQFVEDYNNCDGLDIDEEEDVCITVTDYNAMEQQLVHDKTKEQLKRRKTTGGLLVGYHHGHLNPLPSSWKYPTKMNVIQMITLFQMGNPSEGVAPLKLLKTGHVKHFDKQGTNLSRMGRFMKAVKHFALLRGVWKPQNATNYWNGETVTKLWDGVWDDLSPHLLTETKMKGDKPPSYHKSCTASLAWRTCHDKLMRKGGLFDQIKI
jgi:hypothetical protein